MNYYLEEFSSGGFGLWVKKDGEYYPTKEIINFKADKDVCIREMKDSKKHSFADMYKIIQNSLVEISEESYNKLYTEMDFETLLNIRAKIFG